MAIRGRREDFISQRFSPPVESPQRHPRHAEFRIEVVRVECECLLEQLLGFGRTLRFKEKLSPTGAQVGAPRVGLDRCPECGIGSREVVKSPGRFGPDGRVGSDD